MCRFIESVKVKDGQWHHITYHNRRMENTIREWYGKTPSIDIPRAVPIPAGCRSGLFKCRISYSDQIRDHEFIPYEKWDVSSLQCVFTDAIDYRFKYADRRRLDDLFSRRGICDDILIIHNQLVTDAYASNVLFFDGTTWFTPSTPLLKGTCRSRLLEKGIIREKKIAAEDIHHYLKVRLINAMMEFEEGPEISTTHIFL